MTVQHPELRALAKGAIAADTEGVWYTPDDLRGLTATNRVPTYDAEYIAAVSPDVVLALLVELDTAEQKIAEARKTAEAIMFDSDAEPARDELLRILSGDKP